MKNYFNNQALTLETFLQNEPELFTGEFTNVEAFKSFCQDTLIFKLLEIENPTEAKLENWTWYNLVVDWKLAENLSRSRDAFGVLPIAVTDERYVYYIDIDVANGGVLEMVYCKHSTQFKRIYRYDNIDTVRLYKYLNGHRNVDYSALQQFSSQFLSDVKDSDLMEKAKRRQPRTMDTFTDLMNYDFFSEVCDPKIGDDPKVQGFAWSHMRQYINSKLGKLNLGSVHQLKLKREYWFEIVNLFTSRYFIQQVMPLEELAEFVGQYVKFDKHTGSYNVLVSDIEEEPNLLEEIELSPLGNQEYLALLDKGDEFKPFYQLTFVQAITMCMNKELLDDIYTIERIGPFDSKALCNMYNGQYYFEGYGEVARHQGHEIKLEVIDDNGVYYIGTKLHDEIFTRESLESYSTKPLAELDLYTGQFTQAPLGTTGEQFCKPIERSGQKEEILMSLLSANNIL